MDNEATTMKDAYSHEDGFKEEQLIVQKVDRWGLSKERINTEALYNDRQAFWQYHQKKLVAIIIICCLYFIGVIL